MTIARLGDGQPLGSLPAAPAINALAGDGARRLLLVPSGNAARLDLIGLEQENSPSQHHLLGYVGTRPWAHNMAYDPVRGTAFLFTMDFLRAPTPSTGENRIRSSYRTASPF